MRGFKLLLVTGVVGLAAAGVSVATKGSTTAPSSAVPEAPADAATPLLTERQQQAARDFAKLPVSFIENRGQTDSRVRYYAQGNGYSFFMTPSEVMLAFTKQATTPQRTAQDLALALQFVDSNPAVEPQGGVKAPGVVNDLRGTDPSQWKTDIPLYSDVVYNDLWPNIDLRLREESGVLTYEFYVHPGASPSDIALAYRGADALELNEAGDLEISTPFGVLEDSAPVSYQDIDGVRVPVESRYVLGQSASGVDQFAFEVGSYQTGLDLVIDPGVQYSTFLGGNSAEIPTGIAANAAGNAFVSGTTQSPNFPTTTGAFDRTGATNNFSEVFVTKLNPAGTALVYSTFVGGSNMETGRRIAIDAAGNAYVTGNTKSSNFPTTANAFDRTRNVPPNCPRCSTDTTDSFAFKLNAAGSALVYSTYLGGTDIDDGRSIAVDGSGNAYITGETLSNDHPTTSGAFSRTLRGQYEVFVTKLNPAGSALVYSTFLGGTLSDNGERIAVDSGGNAYVMGFSGSSDFPTTAGSFDRTFNGGFDVTLTKLNPAGSALVYSTFLGTSDFDGGNGLTVDGAGSAYVTGSAPSAQFPTTPGAYDTSFNNSDGFVTKFNPAGSALVYSTFIGGSDFDAINSIVLDPSGNAWLGGGTSSSDFPVTADASDSTYNGSGDATISELNATGTALLFSTYLGGSNGEGSYDIARDSTGDIYVTGQTLSQDFPATVGAFDRVWNGDLQIFWGDGFVTKIDFQADGSTPPAPPAVPATPVLVSPFNGSTQPQPITFDWGETAGAVSFTIQIDNSSSFTAPLEREQSVTQSIAVASGLSTGTHYWRVRGVNSAGVAGPWSSVRSFIAQAAPPPSQLATIDLNPSSIVGGNTSAGTVVMDTSATDGAVITLSSSNPSVASVPPTTTVEPNGFTGSFGVTTSPVSASTSVTITASYNGVSRSAVLTVNPASAGPTLQTIVLSPSSVTGGNSTSGYVQLSGAAPAGGAVVSLSSSNPSVASLASSLTVPEGSSIYGFGTVTTASVSSTTLVTISATYAGITRTATLTVNPGGSQPPPSGNVTLTVSASGRSGERVVSTPTGVSVNVGSSGSASFAGGTSVTLRVSNGRQAIWSGACSSGGNRTTSCTFTINADASVSADVK